MSSFVRSDAFKILVYVFCSILIGALLAPPFFWIGKSVVEAGTLEGKSFLGVDLHDEMDRAKFGRYFNRALLLGALLCLWPTIRWLGAKPKEFFQLDRNPSRWSHSGFGFLLAAAGLLGLGVYLVASGIFEMRPLEKRDPVVEIFFTAIVSGVAVGFLEEFFFRGCLLGLALRTSKPMTALFFTSVFFSAVHFLKPPDRLDYPEVIAWTDGFWLVGQIFAQFGNPVFIMAEFTTLLMVGLILGYTRLRTRSLWMAIGLHAGWVFSLKAFSAFTWRERKLEETLPWIGQDLKSGLFAVMVVTLTGVVVWFWLRKTSQKTEEAPADAEA